MWEMGLAVVAKSKGINGESCASWKQFDFVAAKLLVSGQIIHPGFAHLDVGMPLRVKLNVNTFVR